MIEERVPTEIHKNVQGFFSIRDSTIKTILYVSSNFKINLCVRRFDVPRYMYNVRTYTVYEIFLFHIYIITNEMYIICYCKKFLL